MSNPGNPTVPTANPTDPAASPTVRAIAAAKANASASAKVIASAAAKAAASAAAAKAICTAAAAAVVSNPASASAAAATADFATAAAAASTAAAAAADGLPGIVATLDNALAAFAANNGGQNLETVLKVSKDALSAAILTTNSLAIAANDAAVAAAAAHAHGNPAAPPEDMLNLLVSVPKTIASAFGAPAAAPSLVGDPPLREAGFVSFNFRVGSCACMFRGYEIKLLKGMGILIVAAATTFGVMKLVAAGKYMF